MKLQLCVGLVALALGCAEKQPDEVTGQIFIVRQDRETVKLSGVKIYAGPEDKLRAAIEGARQAVDKEKENIHFAQSFAEERLREAQRAAAEAEREVAMTQNKLSDTNAWLARMESRVKGMAAFANRADETKKLREQAEQGRTNSIHLEAQLKGAWIREAECQAKVETAKQNLAMAERRKDVNPEDELFSAALPSGCATEITDAEGRFRIKVPPKAMLVARADRRTPLILERYFWMQPVTGTNVILSNENMYFHVNREL